MMTRTLFVAMLIIASQMLVSRASAAEAKLDYKQVQLLKDATYYLDQAEGVIQIIVEKSAAMKVGDASVQIQDVQNLLSNKDRVKQYLTNAENRFKQLPLTNSRVKPEADRLQPLKDSLAASEAKLLEVQKSLEGVVAQGGGASFKADFDRLREINQMYSDPSILTRQPERAIDVAKQVPAVKAERARIAEKYADLLKQTTPEAKDMNGVLRYFDEQFGKFNQAATEYIAAAPKQIGDEVAEALKMGNEAVQEKKIPFFGEDGGVNQRLTQAQTQYDVLAALAPDSAETVAAKKTIDAARDQVKQMKASLSEAIIAANTVPASQYNGADKADLIALVKAKWAESGVTGDVLDVGINSQNWQRDTRWEWNNSGWYKIDHSRAQGFVVVKNDETMAAIYYINLSKDHLSADKITTYFFQDPKAEVDVRYKLLLKNIK